jgi:hypothetical protein
MMNERKQLTKVQQYAIAAAAEKVRIAKAELQSIAEEIAIEMCIDVDLQTWMISSDMKYLERKE